MSLKPGLWEASGLTRRARSLFAFVICRYYCCDAGAGARAGGNLGVPVQRRERGLPNQLPVESVGKLPKGVEYRVYLEFYHLLRAGGRTFVVLGEDLTYGMYWDCMGYDSHDDLCATGP